MARHSDRSGDRRGEHPARGWWSVWRMRAVAPLLVLAAAVAASTALCRSLLGTAADGEAVATGELPLYIAAACFLLAAGTVVVIQSIRFADRVAGPEYRLIQSIRRILSGDLAFRVHLRRGDLLRDLADECNKLLDWLNANPPAGAQTGSDLVEVPDAAAD